MSDASNIQTQAQPAPTPKKTVSEWLNHSDFKAQLAAALPKHITPDRMVRVVLTASMKNPKLFQCTQESLFLCVLNCAAVGLEPDGRKAHLIPFANKKKGITECQLIYGYAGLCELVYRSGMVSNIHADIICENDKFSANAGILEEHKIDYRKPRGTPFAAYCLVRFKDGTQMVEIMSKDEIEIIRDNSQGYQAFKKGFTFSSPWETNPMEMWKKTACRRVVKWCPQSAELSQALEQDNSDAIDIDAVTRTAAPLSLASVLDPSTPPAPEPTAEDKANAKAAQDKLREIIIGNLQGAILDGKTTEAELTKIAKYNGTMSPDFAEIWELPTETLAKLTESVK